MILVYAHACWLLFNYKLSLVSPVLVATPVKTLQLATRWDLATMNTIGKIEEFQPEKEKFTSYAERVELFFAANSIPAQLERCQCPRVHKLGNCMISRSAQAGKCTNVHKG